MARYTWIHNIGVENIVGDYTPSGDILTVKAGGTSGISEGEAIFVFDKLGISSLNTLRNCTIYFNKIATNNANLSNDTLNITAELGYYHDITGFRNAQSDMSLVANYGGTWYENSTTQAKWSGRCIRDGDVFNIPSSEKFALKLKFKSSNLNQARFNVTISEIKLDLEVATTDFYYVLDLNGGSCSQGTGVIWWESTRGGFVSVERDGYIFGGWTDGVNTYEGLMPQPSDATYTTDIYYTAVWIEGYEVTVLPSNEIRGTVSGGGIYVKNSVATLRANAKSGYRFLKWDDGNTNNPRQLAVTKSNTYVAKFIPDRDYLELSLIFGEGCSSYNPSIISGSSWDGSLVRFIPNTTLEIKARPKSGYQFSSWEDGSTANPRIVNMDDDITIQAFFEEIEGSNVYVGNMLIDVYVGDVLVDVYVGDVLI